MDPCKWRELDLYEPGLHGCTSPVMRQLAGGGDDELAVTSDFCSSCRACDHADEKQAPPGFLRGLVEELKSGARKVARFGVAVAQHIAAGLPRVKPDEYERRAGICRSCTIWNPQTDGCPKCGCNLAVKRWWTEQKCPDSKW